MEIQDEGKFKRKKHGDEIYFGIYKESCKEISKFSESRSRFQSGVGQSR
jgi:hypothetical protein